MNNISVNTNLSTTQNTGVESTKRLIFASLYTFLVICSILVNSLLILVYLKGNKLFKTNAFFIIAGHVLLCDMTGLLLQIIIVIPTTFAGSLIYSHTFMICVCSLDYITYNLSSYFTFLILIEIVVVSFVGASYATGYYTNFSATEYHFVQESEDGNVLKTIVNVTAYYVPFVMIAIYLFIFAFCSSARIYVKA
uniref:G-protein coupled receptors family 1 profile domain-containing protein n=1 Tax=Ditylenchus dipsaci TaxID=166011 RepID=A0A915E0L6_9BILA